jgi:hypothetical protein
MSHVEFGSESVADALKDGSGIGNGNKESLGRDHINCNIARVGDTQNRTKMDNSVSMI